MAEFKHVTVLLKEAVAGLNVQPTGTYVDATLGGGGHTTDAATSVKNKTISEVKEALIQVLNGR